MQKNLALFVCVADCLPILFSDPCKGIVGVAHAGRSGVFKGIASRVVEVFISLGSNIQDIRIDIGPGAQVCCYEVGKETSEYIDYVDDQYGSSFVHESCIDLAGIVVHQLRKKGIENEHIKTSHICTIDSDNYFSYRCGDVKKRFAGIIALV